MHSIRRSCHSALRKSGAASSYAYANGSSRAFSRSCARSRGALPVYLEPSSPELSSLLSTFNSKILLPYHLTKEQQKLVYMKENQAKLEAEPVEISLGDVTLPLEHIDRNHLPNRWKQLREIVRQSETREDWENVVRILEGFENAGVRVKPEWRELIVRHLNASGNQHLVLKALQRAKATGLRLSDYGVLVQVLRGVHDKAALADWEQEETKKALRLAKQLVELMDDEEHCGGQGRGEMVSENDWRSKPSVIAVPTEMAARLAESHGGNVEEVNKLANRLVTALKQSQFMTELEDTAQRSQTTTFNNVTLQQSFITAHCYELLQLIFIWNALKTSRTVLGSAMPMASEAQEVEARVLQVLTEGVEAVDKLRTRNGKEINNAYVGYVRDALERCR
ncbi:Nn.00g080690.m01.CDS01 [Neocucurbitaria sp. VM-36]